MNYLSESKNYVIALLTLLAVAVWGLGWLSSPAGGVEEPEIVVIRSGASASQIGRQLKDRGLIRSRRAFIFTVGVSGKSSSLKPGAYRLSKQMSMLEIIRKIERGDVAAAWVTIPEGFTVQQIAERLVARGLVSEQPFLEAAREGWLYPDIEAGSDGSLEGYLFPDTYLVPVQTDARTIVKEMVETFRKKVLQDRTSEIESSELSGMLPGSGNLRNVVIVASLIEREAKVPEERAKIAGVIYNRLRLGMKLEIDATVQYARGEHKSRLLYRDLEVDSPYNTYMYRGLPAGPIANPGIPSIDAALRPDRTDALYYVARSDGSHVFSRTLAEHNAAKRKVRSGS